MILNPLAQILSVIPDIRDQIEKYLYSLTKKNSILEEIHNLLDEYDNTISPELVTFSDGKYTNLCSTVYNLLIYIFQELKTEAGILVNDKFSITNGIIVEIPYGTESLEKVLDMELRKSKFELNNVIFFKLEDGYPKKLGKDIPLRQRFFEFPEVLTYKGYILILKTILAEDTQSYYKYIYQRKRITQEFYVSKNNKVKKVKYEDICQDINNTLAMYIIVIGNERVPDTSKEKRTFVFKDSVETTLKNLTQKSGISLCLTIDKNISPKSILSRVIPNYTYSDSESYKVEDLFKTEAMLKKIKKEVYFTVHKKRLKKRKRYQYLIGHQIGH